MMNQKLISLVVGLSVFIFAGCSLQNLKTELSFMPANDRMKSILVAAGVPLSNLKYVKSVNDRKHLAIDTPDCSLRVDFETGELNYFIIGKSFYSENPVRNGHMPVLKNIEDAKFVIDKFIKDADLRWDGFDVLKYELYGAPGHKKLFMERERGVYVVDIEGRTKNSSANFLREGSIVVDADSGQVLDLLLKPRNSK